MAQREHYLPLGVTRFWSRWLRAGAANVSVGLILIASAIAGAFWSAALLLCALAVAVWPLGLPIRGRTTPLALTRRLRTLALVSYVTLVALGSAIAIASTLPLAAAVVALGAPFVVDAACAILRPIESRIGNRYVHQAHERLRRVNPRVVAVTGSYGKTSTKGHIRELLSETYVVVASPASFNNRLGLARAINENLQPGTEVFVAEMGMYGPGEIRALCDWLTPEIAVLTAIGPTHLERLGSIDAIVEAKSEIFETASVAVVNVDSPRLSLLADDLSARSLRVWRCGTAPDANLDVAVVRTSENAAIVLVGGTSHLISIGDAIHPSNLACSIAVACELEVPVERVLSRINQLSVPAHRMDLLKSDGGAIVIDDTFNANPDGAQRALDLLGSVHADGRRVVVTPGIVELGYLQSDANAAFAERASQVADTLVAVGRTNRSALLQGASGRFQDVHCVSSRDQAIGWARSHLGTGDVVLYENDLPDHYP